MLTAMQAISDIGLELFPGPRGQVRALMYGCFAGLLLAAAGEIGHVFVGRNFHAVIPGKVYRCAQCSGEGLEKIIKTYGVQTVVNLRGCSVPLAWYMEESRTTHRCGVCQQDIALSAARLPSVHEVRRLIEVLDRATYPILLHCRHGADRTGLASALVLLLHTETPLAVARRQLGLRYGHFAIDRPAFLDRLLDSYEDWLQSQNRNHSSATLREWVASETFPGECRCCFELLEGPRNLAVGEVPKFRVRVRNTGLKPWQFKPGNTAGYHVVFLIKDAQYRWLNSGRAGLFEAEVGPGQMIDLTLAVPAFRKSGHYRLMVDMLDEHQCWFYQVGTEPMELELDVHERSASFQNRISEVGSNQCGRGQPTGEEGSQAAQKVDHLAKSRCKHRAAFLARVAHGLGPPHARVCPPSPGTVGGRGGVVPGHAGRQRLSLATASKAPGL
jgi:hypothetical protein